MLGQSGPGSNGKEGVLRIPQGPNVTGTSPSDCLLSYPRHKFRFFIVSFGDRFWICHVGFFLSDLSILATGWRIGDLFDFPFILAWTQRFYKSSSKIYTNEMVFYDHEHRYNIKFSSN